jgi:two-component system, sensor histidine kinase
MHRVRYIFILSLFLFCIQSALWAISSPQILILNSYHEGLSWTDSLNAGIRKELLKAFPSSVIYTEYLDAKRNVECAVCKEYSGYFKAKYSRIPLNIIITTDNDALLYIEKQQQELSFLHIPVVFCGVNDLYSFPENYTGVIESVDIAKNMQLINTLYSRLQKLYIIVDNTTTGKILAQQTIREYNRIKPSFELEFLQNYDFEQLKIKVGSLYDGEAIFFLLFNKDSRGRFFSLEESIDSIAAACSVPIFGTWDFYLNHGIIGGNLIMGSQQGKLAAQMSIKILNGAKVSDIPIINGTSSYVFDFKQLHRFKVSESRLPADYQIINSPQNILKQHPGLMITLITIIVVLVVALLLFWFISANRKKQIKTQAEYLDQIEQQKKDLNEAQERAEAASRLKNAFLSNISHEIRTPLNGIIGFSGLLCDESLQMESERKEMYVHTIEENSEILLRLINNIIEVSNIESNQIEFLPEPTYLNHLVYALYETYKPQMSDRVRLFISINKDDPNCQILTDSAKLNAILCNLIENAIRFTQNGFVEFGYSIQNEIITFYVRDTGIGITLEQQKNLFQSFLQGDNSSTRKYGGMGLGLALCKGYVQKLGGKIWVESTVGKGSVFFFTHPYVNMKIDSEYTNVF